jgi:hypothetical protein
MIKKYLLDILCITGVVLIALLVVERPVVNLDLRPSAADKGQLSDAKKEEAEKIPKGIMGDVVAIGVLKERNIFSPDGSYTMSETGLKGPLPENPFTLIGILQGEEKKAVFKDYTGAIITLTVGKKLTDGSVITRIEQVSVQLEKGNEKKELKLFDLTNPNRRVPSKQEIRPRPEQGAVQRPGGGPPKQPRK